MSINLKHIPCPAGNKCTAFRCLFGHEADNVQQAGAAPAPAIAGGVTSQPHLQRPHEEQSQSNTEPPRKRQRTDGASRPSSSDANGAGRANANSHGTGSTPSTTPHKIGENITQTSRVGSITRPISPPTVKRKAAGSTQAHASPQEPKASGTKSLNSPASQENKKPKKLETLNPRLIRRAPAGHDQRFKLLKMVHTEMSRLNKELEKDANDEEKELVLSEQDLICRALDDEQTVALEKAAVYLNVMKNKVMQYKRMGVGQWKAEREKEKAAARKARQGADASEEPKIIETGLTPAQEVQVLRRLLTKIDHLTNHGYVSEVPAEEAIDKAKQGIEASLGWEKCDRCQQRFQVFPGRREEDGALTSGGPCNFHWGRAYVPAKAPGETARILKRYRCCGEEVGESAGCYVRDHHVFKVSDPKRLAVVLNFASTPEKPLPSSHEAVCFDCEMCYTVHGMELVRVTATAWPGGEELLDVLVRPYGEILDLNSRFSGVWPDDMAHAEPWLSGADQPKDVEAENERKRHKIVSSPEVARDLLFSLISPSTILIGHGLENDLNAMRIVHPRLVDTVLLYPHRGGLPFRNGLKMLMDHHLNRKIQQESNIPGQGVKGHDSAEDARAAGELARLRVAREWKDMAAAGWKISDGEFMHTRREEKREGNLTEEFIEA